MLAVSVRASRTRACVTCQETAHRQPAHHDESCGRPCFSTQREEGRALMPAYLDNRQRILQPTPSMNEWHAAITAREARFGRPYQRHRDRSTMLQCLCDSGSSTSLPTLDPLRIPTGLPRALSGAVAQPSRVAVWTPGESSNPGSQRVANRGLSEIADSPRGEDGGL